MTALLENIFEMSYLLIILKAGVIVGIAAVMERVITKYLRRFASSRELPPNVGNGLVLIFRLLVLFGAITALSGIAGVPTEWFVGFYALGGTAIGFASTRTIGNFIAGIYVLATRPFRVNDYISVGGIEGVVEEITINYTKIRTPANTIVSMSNQKILEQNVVNYRYEEGDEVLYCYSFELGFDHSLPTDRLEQIFDEIIERYAEKLPRRPEYGMTKLTRVDRYYMFYLYVKDPKDVFTIQPMFMREITQAWDKAKSAG